MEIDLLETYLEFHHMDDTMWNKTEQKKKKESFEEQGKSLLQQQH